jgi:tetratricopeptide (TPR) repeat protein
MVSKKGNAPRLESSDPSLPVEGPIMLPSPLVHHLGSRMGTDQRTDCQVQMQWSFERFSAKKQAKRSTSSPVKQTPPRKGAPAKKHKSYTNTQPLLGTPRHHSGPRLSLCMIVRDEEDNFAACLKSAANLVDEIVVVDTGSTDRTRNIARRLGARVFDFPWVDDFAVARNESLRHATGDWIFWLDADERIDAPNRAKMQRLVAGLGKEKLAFEMTGIHLPGPGRILMAEATSVRLFRNHPELRWQNRIHEDLMPALRAQGVRVVRTEIEILHTGYQDPAVRARKNERDLRLLLMDFADGAETPSTFLNIARIYLATGRAAEALPILQRGVDRSDPSERPVRGLYRLIVECHRSLGQRKEALAACAAGRAHYPLDAGLRLQEGQAREEAGDDAGAEHCYLQLLQNPQPDDLTNTPAGMVGFLARHRLAALYAKQGQTTAAESLW